VHGELGGSLEMRLSFLTLVVYSYLVLISVSFITEDNKQAVSLHSSDYMCINYINGSATGQSQVCMRILTSKERISS